MIKYFRKIRKNLISNGKTGKYLKYAVGEIVLVVIGILIALQINNWNEHRKAKLNDIQLCKELLNEAIADSVFFASRHVGLNQLKSTVNYILEEPALRKADSLILEISGRARHFFTYTGFRYLSNVVSNQKNSIQELQSKSVISALRRYFLQYDYVAGSFERLNTYNGMELNPLKKKHMKNFMELRESKNLDILNEIYDDKEVQESVFLIDGFIDDALNHLLVFQGENQALIKVLKEHLSKDSKIELSLGSKLE